MLLGHNEKQGLLRDSGRSSPEAEKEVMGEQVGQAWLQAPRKPQEGEALGGRCLPQDTFKPTRPGSSERPRGDTD